MAGLLDRRQAHVENGTTQCEHHLEDVSQRLKFPEPCKKFGRPQ